MRMGGKVLLGREGGTCACEASRMYVGDGERSMWSQRQFPMVHSEGKYDRERNMRAGVLFRMVAVKNS